LKRFLQSWLVNTLAVLVAVYLVEGIHYGKPLDLLAASLVLGILNAVLRPLLLLLALPLVFFTLGLFLWVINATLLYLVGILLQPHFHVDTFWDALWGALIISFISLVLNTLMGTSRSKVRFQRRRRPPSRSDDDGPVIDV
jgi:putative membrane protein